MNIFGGKKSLSMFCRVIKNWTFKVQNGIFFWGGGGGGVAYVSNIFFFLVLPDVPYIFWVNIRCCFQAGLRLKQK